LITASVEGGPRLLLRIEGGALLLAALVGYGWTGGSWWLFAALILVPDASMAGYLVNPKVGAASYNAAHSTAAPLLLLAGSLCMNAQMILGLALIWLAHVGLDRMLGYGLKYATGFKDTHLGSLNASR
jgi:hypothetical protein